MSNLQISLFGPFQVTVNGQPVNGFLSDKVRALLAYLVVEHTRPFRREALAGLLWSEQTDTKARANLRRALANMRQLIDDKNGHYLDITWQTLQFNKDCNAQVDVHCFAEQLTNTHSTITQMEKAISYVNGRFLEGFSIPDSITFEEWLLFKREQCQQQILDCLNRLTRHYEQQNRFDEALNFAWQQVQLEPWHESGQRQLLRLLTHSGQRATAVSHFERFRAELVTELGITPEPETVLLIDQIRNGTFTVHNSKGKPISLQLQTAVSEQIPTHFVESGHWQKAIIDQQLAGKRALHHSANEEAVSHFREALTLLANLPETAVRSQQEMDLQISLGTALLALKGYAHPDVKTVFDRARNLHNQLAPELQIFISLFRLSSYYAVSGDLETALIIGRQMIDITKLTASNSLHCVMAHLLTGIPLFFMGSYHAALRHFDEAIAAYDPTIHREIASTIGQDLGISSHIWAGHTYCHLGCISEAKTHLNTALDMLTGLDHPHTAVFTHLLAAGTPYAYYIPNDERALHHLQQALNIATKEHFVYLQNLTQFYITYSKTQQTISNHTHGSSYLRPLTKTTTATIRDAITQMHNCIQFEQQIGAQLGMSSRYIMLANFYGRIHKTETATTLLTQANALIHKNHEHYFEPELYRVQASIHYVNNDPLAAHQSLQRAISIAKKQEAHLWTQKSTQDISEFRW